VIIKVIKIYQFIISPFLGKNCRFLPTCSQYTIESVKKNGAFYGITLSIARILKCNPFFKGGVDEVRDISKTTIGKFKMRFIGCISILTTILLLSCLLVYAKDIPIQKPSIDIDISSINKKNLSKKDQQKLNIIKKIENIRKKYIFNQNFDIKSKSYHKIQNIKTKRKPYNKFARKKNPYSLVVDNRTRKNRHISFLLKKKHLLSGIFNAIYEGDSQSFLAFVKKLNDPNAFNVVTGETLLTEAIKLKRRRIIYHLISFGANLDKTNLKKESPTCIAIKTKNAAVVSSLLKFGAKRDVLSNGETYLIKAIKTNHIPTIKAVLDAGVPNAYTMNNNSINAIDLAYIGKKQVIVKLLEKYGFFLHK
jgi:putative membrane protein insertion efficiency factor